MCNSRAAIAHAALARIMPNRAAPNSGKCDHSLAAGAKNEEEYNSNKQDVQAFGYKSIASAYRTISLEDACVIAG